MYVTLTAGSNNDFYNDSSSTGITFSSHLYLVQCYPFISRKNSQKNKTRTHGRCSIKESELLIFHREICFFV